MHPKESDRPVFIISEVHPQHSGNRSDLERMILQSKLGGADAVKVQLYDTQALHGDREREYLQIHQPELADIKAYADRIGIEMFASVFDEDRLQWCEDLGFKRYKIASRSVADRKLCHAVISTGKPVYISLGKHDWQKSGLPYQEENLVYFHCVTNYPTLLDEIQMPSFSDDGVLGYSDHTIGLGACLYAVSRGALYLEKHFTLDKARQTATEKAHLGAMDADELARLRSLVDDIATLRRRGIQ